MQGVQGEYHAEKKTLTDILQGVSFPVAKDCLVNILCLCSVNWAHE